MKCRFVQERGLVKSEFDEAVSYFRKQLFSANPEDRCYIIVDWIRETQMCEGVEFTDRVNVLKAAVQRGNLTKEVLAASKILEDERSTIYLQP